MDINPTIQPQQDAINILYKQLRDQQAGAKMHTEASRNGTRPSPSADDQLIIHKAAAAKNGDKFQRLWDGDTSDYSFLNADGSLNLGHSEADLALCRELTFWTQDKKQIDRIFRGSGLYRDKWDRDDYRAKTIQLALETTPEHWRGVSAESNGQSEDEGTGKEGNSSYNGDEHQEEPASTGELSSSKRFFRKKTFIPKRLGDCLLARFHIKYAAGMLWVYRNGVYVADGERILAAAAQQFLGEERRQNRIEETLRYIEVATYTEMPPPDLRYINLLNGRLEWSTGILHEHSPNVFSVMQLPVN